MLGKMIYRYAIDEDRVYWLGLDEKNTPGFFVPIENKPNHYLAGLGNKAVVFKWDGHKYKAERVQELFSAPAGIELNGLVVSPQNDWYIGNYAPGFCAAPATQSLFGYLRDKQFVKFGGSFNTSVGEVMIGQTVYQIDACTKTLSAFDWNPDNGQLSELRNYSFYLKVYLRSF